jgi:hypothetical protein
MFTRYALSLLTVAIFGVGCSSDQTTAPDTGATEFESAIDGSDFADQAPSGLHFGGHHSDHETTFVVRIENVSTASTLSLSNGESVPVPHAPGVWTVSRRVNTLFRAGSFDRGHGLEELAEDGNPERLFASLESSRIVKSSGVFNTPDGDAGPGAATPGKAYEFTVTASPGDRLSFATMFVQSNDLFYAPSSFGIPLFLWGRRPISGDVTRFVKLWDAGTELNQEPGLGSDQAPRQSGPDTGESERRRIVQVDAHWFFGHRDRDPFDYPSTEEVIKVTITPVEDTQSLSASL